MTFANVCKAPGKIGILMGNPRYRNQEMNEAGFRSYFREHAQGFTLLEPISTARLDSLMPCSLEAPACWMAAAGQDVWVRNSPVSATRWWGSTSIQC